MPTTPARRAFTLIELLVVLAIIAVLVGLLLPAVQKVREASFRLKCQNHLKQLALAAHHYHDGQHTFPPGLVPADHDARRYAGATNLWVELLPSIEQTNLKDRWDYRDYRRNFAGGTAATTAVVVSLLVCPADYLPAGPRELLFDPPYDWFNGHYGQSSYGGNGGTLAFNYGDPVSNDGVFFVGSRVRLTAVTDGASNTFLLGERSHRDPEFDRATLAHDPLFYPLDSWGIWAAAYTSDGALADVMLGTPCRINYRVPPGADGSDWTWERNRLNAFGSEHPGGANFAFVDGSVRFVADGIPLRQLQGLSTRATGEVVEVP